MDAFGIDFDLLHIEGVGIEAVAIAIGVRRVRGQDVSHFFAVGEFERVPVAGKIDEQPVIDLVAVTIDEGLDGFPESSPVGVDHGFDPEAVIGQDRLNVLDILDDAWQIRPSLGVLTGPDDQRKARGVEREDFTCFGLEDHCKSPAAFYGCRDVRQEKSADDTYRQRNAFDLDAAE